MSFVACTRMYDVTPEVRRHWHALMTHAGAGAELAVECIDHPPPATLTELWARDDLVLGFMCGLPLATRYPEVALLAAPVTALSEGDRPTYRSVWLVRADSAFATLASTFGHRIGWIVEHSHSGFNAPRHALLGHRSRDRASLYRESVGPLGVFGIDLATAFVLPAVAVGTSPAPNELRLTVPNPMAATSARRISRWPPAFSP